VTSEFRFSNPGGRSGVKQ